MLNTLKAVPRNLEVLGSCVGKSYFHSVVVSCSGCWGR